MGKIQQKGAAFEQLCADYLTEKTGQEVIRQRTHGNNDKGDLYGAQFNGEKLTVECKDCRKMELSQWLTEAEAERKNNNSEYAIVIHHRRGKGAKNFGENYVTMTVDNFLKMSKKLKKPDDISSLTHII